MRLQFNSAIVRFVLVMLLTLVLPFTAVLLLTTNRLSQMETENANQYLQSNLKTISATIDQALRNLEFSHTAIFMDRDFMASIKRLKPYDAREEYTDYKDTNGIKGCIGRIAATNDYIDSIYAYSFPAQRIFSSRTNWDPAFNHFTQAIWLDNAGRAGRYAPWVITKEIRTGRTILSSYREVWTYGDDSPVGLISINVDASSITGMLGSVSSTADSYSFILDAHGQIVGYESYEGPAFDRTIALMNTADREGYFDFRYGGEDMFVSYYTSDYSGFRYVIATPLDGLQTSVPVMVQLIMMFLALLVLMGVLSMILVRHYFFSPTKALFRGMAKVEAGDFSVRLPANPTQEFGYINREFNRMAESIDRLITENYTNMLVNKEAQLKNIQNQLNEHFLYNTLDSIHWLARLENAQKASEMVFALAHFYRHSLSSGRDIITVSQVMEMLKNYLFIQKFRLRDAMNYTLKCDPELLERYIPKNAMQPLVENAIVHGIKDLTRRGMIDIEFKTIPGGMRLSVSDNGNGFDEERLFEVRKQLDMKNAYCEHSFALKTVQSQLQIYYGEPVQLHIDTVDAQGTAIWADVHFEGEEARDA